MLNMRKQIIEFFDTYDKSLKYIDRNRLYNETGGLYIKGRGDSSMFNYYADIKQLPPEERSAKPYCVACEIA